MYLIVDYDDIQIYITDGWREWYLPKFRIFITTDEPDVFIWYTNTEQGDGGLTRLLQMDYTDVDFGYGQPVPSSASEVKVVMEQYIRSGFGGGSTPALDAVLLVGNNTGGTDILIDAGDRIVQDDATASTITIWDASKNLESASLATYPSLTELSYVKGVTSAIQTQLDAKLSATSARAYPFSTLGASVNHTGTTANTKVYSVLIPAGTIGNNDYLKIGYGVRKLTGSGSLTMTMYLNTSDAIGGTSITTPATGSNQTITGEPRILWRNSSTDVIYSVNNANPFGAFGAAMGGASIDNTADIWVVIAIQLSVGTDTSTLYFLNVEHYKV